VAHSDSVAVPNEVYERAMAEAVGRAVGEGFTHVAFGDLFLEDIRRYREERLAGTGLTPIFPLFGLDTATLARTMVAGGLKARLTCVNPKVIDARFAGREFDAALLDELPASVDPCGERGEFHSFAYDGPMFSRPIAIESGEVVERDGFVFADSRVIAVSAFAALKLTMRYPERIVCLTEETTETLYLLGQGDRIVGVSGYTVRPPEARLKPKISAFINAKFDKIVALQPTSSWHSPTLQADLAPSWSAAAAGRHLQPAQRRRDPPDDSNARRPGRLPGRRRGAGRAARSGSRADPRVRVALSQTAAAFFRRVGRPAHLGHPLGGRTGRDRRRPIRFSGARRMRARQGSHRRSGGSGAPDPEVIFASWCGKKMKKATIQNRPGWDRVAAVRDDRIFEIKSTYILQPGAGLPDRRHRPASQAPERSYPTGKAHHRLMGHENDRMAPVGDVAGDCDRRFHGPGHLVPARSRR
jgi:hypothetical protein